jgi:glucuronate isomerase
MSATAPATPEPYEKFLAYAAHRARGCLRNPLYHWTAPGAASGTSASTSLLNEDTAPSEVWEQANRQARSR